MDPSCDDHTAPDTSVRPETRERYLAVGAALAEQDVVSDPPYAHVTAHVKLAEVARRLGVSRSSLYRRWATQHDYWSDLVLYMVTRQRPLIGAYDEDGLRPGDPAACLELLRIQGGALQDALARSPRRFLRTGLLGYPPDPAHAEPITRFERQERLAAAHQLERLLVAAGRTPVDPLTADDLVTALWILSDGVAHLGAVDPDHAATILVLDGQEWTLTAYATRCILMTLTRPSGERASAPVPPPPPEPSVADLPRAWTREQVAALAEGARIFAEHLTTDTGPGQADKVLGHVTLARVARAAGVSRRQLYHLWSSHEAFRRDLLAHVQLSERAAYRSRFDEGLGEALAAPDVGRIALEVCEHINRERLADVANPPLRPRFALEPHLGDPIVLADARAGLDRVLAFHQERIDAFIALAGVATREGVTPAHVNQLFTASAHGSETLHRIDPAAIRTGLPYRGGRYSTYSIALQAVVDHSLDERSSDTPEAAVP